MSTRPAHGDFDEVPRAHRPHHALPSTSASRRSRPPSIASSTPPTSRTTSTPAYAAGVSWKQAMAYCALAHAKRPASPGACPPKPSGSTSPAPAARESSATPTRQCPARPAQRLRRQRTWASAAPSGPSTGTRPTSPATQVDPIGAASGYDQSHPRRRSRLPPHVRRKDGTSP